MSSHHFVREDQEPALVVFDLAGIPLELLGNLLEWSPYVIVNESILETFSQMGFKVDAVMRETPEDTSNSQDSIRSIQVTSAWDFDSIENELITRGQRNVNLITTESHLFHLASQTLFGRLESVILTEKYRYIRSSGSFSKWYPSASSIKILSIKNPVISTTGFEVNYSDHQLAEPLILKTELDGLISIKSNQAILIAEYY